MKLLGNCVPMLLGAGFLSMATFSRIIESGGLLRIKYSGPKGMHSISGDPIFGQIRPDTFKVQLIAAQSLRMASLSLQKASSEFSARLTKIRPSENAITAASP